MKIYTALFLLLFNMVVLSSCGAVETIFKAGMWWAFFLVGLIIVVILIVVSKARK
ncbi:MAG: phosphatidate cytidylyltransferase [Chitinophagaceae bacterium]|nr:phosphatidate cytidylyltransferase [Chitinophagaceae bacterium]